MAKTFTITPIEALFIIQRFYPRAKAVQNEIGWGVHLDTNTHQTDAEFGVDGFSKDPGEAVVSALNVLIVKRDDIKQYVLASLDRPRID